MQDRQLLHWSISKPLRYLGLTLDEWGVLFLGLAPGIILINSVSSLLGALFITGGVAGCWGLKRWKKLSTHVLLKSLLMAKGWWPKPRSHPQMLHRTITR